ncbi:helix-turn-helix domain-containing protein [Flavobacterium sp.]|uniref:helix-turn-helix domain-containing protein n=1 Tax=Flavobacterium sp. TaxID=239 RepID=UPI0040339EC6
MELHIKNMVCPRCIITVEKLLETLQLDYAGVALGAINLKQELSAAQLQALDQKLSGYGFSIITKPNEVLVEKVKNCIISIIHNQKGIQIKENFSGLIRAATGTDYSATSILFSASEGVTIEKYIILQRIERAKELLTYNDLTLGEIANVLGYSSPQHLSAQFRKITGLTATAFRKTGADHRVCLDSF